jgi:excisionase family DNA binding protein
LTSWSPDADRQAARPWLTLILDDCSRAVAGYTVFIGAPSALNLSLALRQAIWRKPDPAWPVHGLPDMLYVDHDSDFTSRHIAQAAADLHIQLVHSATARPQGRGKVERLFGTITSELLPELPGHIVNGTPASTAALTLVSSGEVGGTIPNGGYHRFLLLFSVGLRYLAFGRNLELLEALMPDSPARDPDPHAWLTVEEVSNELSVHQVTVRDWINRGLLDAKKAGRRRWRVQRQALQEFLDRGGSSRAEEEPPPPDRYSPPTEYAAAIIDTLSSGKESS